MKTRMRHCMRSLSFIALIMLVQIPAMAQDACEGPSRRFQLVIVVVGNAPSEVTRGGANADNQNVCRGDTVVWRLPATSFTLTFDDDTPFDSAVLESDVSNAVSATVTDDAVRGQRYKYNIELANGEILDPRIIVD